jgi:hypothetical protein
MREIITFTDIDYLLAKDNYKLLVRNAHSKIIININYTCWMYTIIINLFDDKKYVWDYLFWAVRYKKVKLFSDVKKQLKKKIKEYQKKSI